jgi:hypothetical protein
LSGRDNQKLMPEWMANWNEANLVRFGRRSQRTGKSASIKYLVFSVSLKLRWAIGVKP